MESRSALFREIHKNTWLKRLTAEGRKVTVGTRKSERSWVVFCVHDDTEALLEGYVEPRLASSHTPDWVVSLKSTQHISHSLVPNEHEYEFVVTLSEEVIRFHAASWEIMQEWVDTLRSKLREMRILSPRENLYTKLPEARAPLLPTRDPTSPLPATPPVPAAIVPGIERVVPSTSNSASNPPAPPATSSDAGATGIQNTRLTTSSNSAVPGNIEPLSTVTAPATTGTFQPPVTSVSMSNTLSQNLLNLLSDPISNYSVQVNESNFDESQSLSDSAESETSPSAISKPNDIIQSPTKSNRTGATTSSSTNRDRDDVPSLAQTFTNNVLSDPNTCPVTSHSVLVKSNSVVVSTAENSIRVDVNLTNTKNKIALDSTSASEPNTPSRNHSTPITIPRPQTSRSISLTETPINRPAVSVVSEVESQNNITEVDVDSSSSSSAVPEASTNITIIQVSNTLQNTSTPDVFRFPPLEQTSAQEEYKSNVQIIPSTSNVVPTTSNNCQYASPNKIKNNSVVADTNKVTTVRVSGNSTAASPYGKVNHSTATAQTPSLNLKKVILSTNTSGITNIAVGSDNSSLSPLAPSHYEKVFLSSSSSLPVASTSQTPLSSGNTFSQSQQNKSPARTKPVAQPRTQLKTIRTKTQNSPAETTVSIANHAPSPSTPSTSSQSVNIEHVRKSPALIRKRNQLTDIGRENMPPPITNRPLLTRGLTEAVITARPSRIDSKRSKVREEKNTPGAHDNVDRTRSESLEQRRRSSSTSDAHPPRSSRQNNAGRIQATGQPFRLAQENGINQASKRLTLREQQVLQLRREIMHPGGVRLQLRRKDCIGSIAWVEAFGAVWVSGWKQKDHPMLYNALHIGDQLISIAGSPISTPAEANKIIRNTNTLFLEILIRRVPFGRVYAIRRELDGQCLGLIRDGNTATIVDVVPNSLAARHGLPPKAQSCDGLSLTFWVLTEINGRPLNLFFKENEVRDRLNSVGRDISILVQPSDLITKLKKQLKSLRSHKDYIVQ